MRSTAKRTPHAQDHRKLYPGRPDRPLPAGDRGRRRRTASAARRPGTGNSPAGLRGRAAGAGQAGRGRQPGLFQRRPHIAKRPHHPRPGLRRPADAGIGRTADRHHDAARPPRPPGPPHPDPVCRQPGGRAHHPVRKRRGCPRHPRTAHQLHAGQPVPLFRRPCTRNAAHPPDAGQLERRGPAGHRTGRGPAAGTQLEELFGQQPAVRLHRQLSGAGVRALLRGGGHRPRCDLGRRHHPCLQLADGTDPPGPGAAAGRRPGRPGVRAMVQDPRPRRGVHRPQSRGHGGGGRCGPGGRSPGRKHPPDH